MIIVLTATPGCGKTNHAVWSIIKPAVESGRVVYVNRIPDLKLAHIKLTDRQLNRWHERTYDDPDDIEGKSKLNNILEGSILLNQIFVQAQGYYNNVPVFTLQILNLAGFGDAMGIVMGAVLARAAFVFLPKLGVIPK